MSVCVYDNPATWCRECWQDGKLIYSYNWQVLDLNPPIRLFFGANVGPWQEGRLVGDKQAMEKQEEL